VVFQCQITFTLWQLAAWRVRSPLRGALRVPLLLMGRRTGPARPIHPDTVTGSGGAMRPDVAAAVAAMTDQVVATTGRLTSQPARPVTKPQARSSR